MPATLAELKAACQGASSDFLLQQLEAQAEVGTALQAYNTQLRQELANRPATPPKPVGVTPAHASHKGDDGADGAEEFSNLVDTFMTKHPDTDRLSAVQSVALRHPEAHQRFVAATQENGSARRKVADKYAIEA